MGLGFVGRTYGAAATRQMAATIQVFTAGELRTALTTVYGRPDGVGDIQIAGDIVITEPIVLRAFNQPGDTPRQITISAINGARLSAGPNVISYDWNETQTSMPVFDFGLMTTSPCLGNYTFNGLNINSLNAPTFGALVACDLGGDGTDLVAHALAAPIVNVFDLKATSLYNVFGTYDSTGLFYDSGFGDISTVAYTGSSIDGIILDNTALTPTSMGLNTQRAVLVGCGVQNVAGLSGVSTENQLIIRTTPGFARNTFSGITSLVQFEPFVPGFSVSPTCGDGNVFTGLGIQTFGDYGGWTFIGGSGGHVFAASRQLIAHSTAMPGRTYIGGVDPPLATNTFRSQWQSNNFQITSVMAVGRVGPETISLTDPEILPADCFYNVEWDLTCQIKTGADDGKVSRYKITCTFRTDSSHNITVLTTSTTYAYEEPGSGVGGLDIPLGLTGPSIALAPTRGWPAEYLWTQCTVTLEGIRLPIFDT
jgi:hypothetical protein